VTSSKRIFESDYVPRGVPFYRSKEVGELSKYGSTSASFYISEEKYLEIKESRDFPKPGDLLLTSVGSIGNTWIVDDRRFYFKDGNVTQIVKNNLVSIRYLQRFI
jgi:type I restriction enzyme, S subunit